MEPTAPALAASPPWPWRRYIPLLALLLGAVGIAFAPIFVKLADVGPNAVALWRFAASLPLLWLMGRVMPAPPRAAAPYGLLKGRLLVMGAGGLFALDLIFWHASLHLTNVANSTLLSNLAPIFVTLGAWWWLKEKVRPLFLAGLLVALAGAAALVSTSAGMGAGNMRGDMLAIVAALFYASYIVAVRGLRRYYGTREVMFWSSVGGALVMIPVALLMQDVLFPSTALGWVAVLGSAMIVHVGGQGLIAYALASLQAGFSSVTLLLQPCLAALLAWLLLGQSLSLPQLAGGALVLAGIFICGRASRKE